MDFFEMKLELSGSTTLLLWQHSPLMTSVCNQTPVAIQERLYADYY